MRWLFLILLLLNGALFGWFYQEQQARARMAERSAQAVPALGALTLLEEASPDQLRERPPAVAPEPPPAEAPAAPRYCYRLGPFVSEALAALFDRELDYAPGRSEVVAGRIPVEPEYWIYVTRPGSEAERRALRRELKVDGLESYWVRRGELKGQLSLGLYRSHQSAEALLTALLDQGYPAKLYEKPRYEPAYFLDVTTENPGFPGAAWRREMARAHPDVKSEKKSCAGLATGKIPE